MKKQEQDRVVLRYKNSAGLTETFTILRSIVEEHGLKPGQQVSYDKAMKLIEIHRERLKNK